MNKDTRGLDALLNYTKNTTVMSDEELMQLEYINVNIDLIKPNKLNKAPMSDIDELTTAIQVQGLKSPLVAYTNEDNTYTLLSGHRRRLALLNANIKEVPVIIVEKPNNEREERKALIIFNAQRQETTDDINNKILEIGELYDLEKENDPTLVLGRKSEYIVSMLGVNISSRTVERRMKEMRDEDNAEPKEEKEIDVTAEVIKGIRNIKKQFNKLIELQAEHEIEQKLFTVDEWATLEEDLDFISTSSIQLLKDTED